MSIWGKNNDCIYIRIIPNILLWLNIHISLKKGVLQSLLWIGTFPITIALNFIRKIFLGISFVMCCCIEWQKIIQSTKLCPSYYVHFNPLPYIYIRTQTLVLVNSMWNSQCSFDSKEWKKKVCIFFHSNPLIFLSSMASTIYSESSAETYFLLLSTSH